MNVTLREASGKVHENIHVHGCMDRQMLEREIRRATKGKPLLCCVEMSPGCARAYVRRADADVDERAVDLHGAVIVDS
jgi:hypothetical protein